MKIFAYILHAEEVCKSMGTKSYDSAREFLL